MKCFSFRFLLPMLGLLLLINACRPEEVPADAVLSGSIDSDRTLEDRESDPSKPDYCVEGNLSVNAILTVEPGVIICFKSGASMEVNDGAVIIAQGTASAPIRFTGETEIRGFWNGVLVESGDVRNVFEHVTIEFAGNEAVNNIWYDVAAGLAVRDIGEMSIRNCTFRENEGYGLAVQDGGELRSFSSNAFEDNESAAMLLAAQHLAQLDAATKTVGGNGYEGVEVIASTLDLSGEKTWPAFADGGKYKISGDLDVESGLKIAAGATFEFEPGKRLLVGDQGGYLIAQGSASKPITFTGVVRSSPSWNGFIFYSGDARNLMEFCVVEYGGNDPASPIWYNTAANVALRDIARLTVRNSTIRNSGGCGLAAQEAGDLTESGNTFSNNVGGNICN
jgi:hypothetical protein